MAEASKAGAVYAVIVFLFGFVLGTVRVLLIMPFLGETTAVMLETPLILAASWFTCRRCVERFRVPRRISPRSLMGIVAFAVLMAEEIALGRLLFGRSVSAQLAIYGSVAGAIGVVAQIVFATFPLVQVWRR